jgi:hypothetical protein
VKRAARAGGLHFQPCLGHTELQHSDKYPVHHYYGTDRVPNVPVWSSVKSTVRDVACAASHAAGHGGDGCV